MLAYPGWSGEGDHFIGKGSNQIEARTEIQKSAQRSKPNWRKSVYKADAAGAL
jgi:hypothetical protein